MLKVNVRCLTGEKFDVNVEENTTLGDLYALLEKKDVSLKGCKLFYKGRRLEGEVRVCTLGIDSTSFLTAVTTKKSKKRKKSTDRGKQKDDRLNDAPVSRETQIQDEVQADVWAQLSSELVESNILKSSDDDFDPPTDPCESNRPCDESGIAERANSNGNKGKPGKKGDVVLPRCLVRLQDIFDALNGIYGFLMRHHIQPTWANVREALQRICHDDSISNLDLLHMAEICGSVIAVRESASGHVSFPKDAWNTNTEDEIGPANSSRATWVHIEKLREKVASAQNGNGIRDGCGTVLAGDLDTVVIQLVSPVSNVQDSESPVKKKARQGSIRSRKKAFSLRLKEAAKKLQDDFLSQKNPTRNIPGNITGNINSPGNQDGRNQQDLDAFLDGISVDDVIEVFKKIDAEKGDKMGSSQRPPRPPTILRQSNPCKSTRNFEPSELLEHLQKLGWYNGQVVHCEEIPQRSCKFAETQYALSDCVKAALISCGINQLFFHQAQAIDAVHSGNNVVVSTSTASGKSLCYNIPILEAFARNPNTCALYMFPTKALAQDQLRALREICKKAFGNRAPNVEVYDGDTVYEERAGIRDRAQLLITNPDMLHLSILPVHSQFGRVLANLAYVVVDEGHAYKGVFGCHTAMVLRRLRRICEKMYGVEPRFIMTSATVANPKEHMQQLVGVDNVSVISEDGSPHGFKKFIMWNPPLSVSSRIAEGASEKQEKKTKKKKKPNTRDLQEKARSELREANQVRCRGSQLVPDRGMDKDDWVDAVAKGKRTALSASAATQSVKKKNEVGIHKKIKEESCAQDSMDKESLKESFGEASGSDRAASTRAVLENVVVQNSNANKRQLIRKGKKNDGVQDLLDEISERLPGSDWKGRYGKSGITAEQRRCSPIVELSLLLAECIQHGLRTIAFCHTRKLCELVTAYTREVLNATAPDLSDSVRVYRAGYSPQERRETEAALFKGTLRGVAATNALELGVDVGDLDVTLHLGFPGSIASLWQQSGRAGRREQESLSIILGFDGPLDQYFMRNPNQLFEKPIERVQVDANNVHLLHDHIMCGAKEVPVCELDEKYFGKSLLPTIERLVKKGMLCRPANSSANSIIWRYTGRHPNPASNVSLRAIDPERYAIVDEANDNRVIEEIEESKAFFEVYEGAVYMYRGCTYLCTKLNLDKKVAFVRPADLKYYTRTRDFTDVHVLGGSVAYPVKAAVDGFPATSAVCAESLVTIRWLGFHRIWQGTGIAFDSVDLFLPDMQYETQATFIRVPHSARFEVKKYELPFRDGLHAANHAVLNVLPLYLMCNAGDMGTECDSAHDTRYRPERILVYDKHPGGIGLSAQARPLMAQLLTRAYLLVLNCPCDMLTGCPCCIQHPKCPEYNVVLCKPSALVILRSVLLAEGCAIPEGKDIIRDDANQDPCES